MASTDLTRLVGNTPLVELTQLSPKPGVRIFAKLEGNNPTGSLKDRVALALVESAERKGLLQPGDSIIEASSGNTALALGFVAKQRGYHARVVLPRGVAPSIGDLLALYGVDIEWSEARAGLLGAIEKAKRCAEQEGCHLLGQFSNDANVEVHYRDTGGEILRDLPRVDVFIAGIGTSGTVMGVGRRLKEACPGVHIIGVEPRLGDRLQGLRNLNDGFIPPLLDLDKLDGRFLVDSASAFECVRHVAEAEGIFVGVSSGATLHVARRLAARMSKGNIVVMFADGGGKYLPSRPWRAAARRSRSLDDVHWW
jgi:cysteine synthase B